MDVQFQKSIFGILVPNGPYSKVLPYGHVNPYKNGHYGYLVENGHYGLT